MKALALTFLVAAGAADAAPFRFPSPFRFTNPLQQWSSADGQVHLLRPITAAVTTSGDAVGSLMTPGWRLIWTGSDPTPGRLVARFALRVAAAAPQSRRTEYLQIGVGRSPKAVRGCLTDGLKGIAGSRRPDRFINGRRYAVWTNADAGMSQQIAATDLRTVAAGACYAIERFSYGDSASDPDPAVTMTQQRGADMLDQSLASLRIGLFEPTLKPPSVPVPPGAVAR